MALLFLETSALVKLYVREAGTERMLELVDRKAGHECSVLALSRVEFHSAVARRARQGDLTPSIADDLRRRFAAKGNQRFIVQPVTERVMDEAVGLIARHALRAFDALQLAGARVVRATMHAERTSFVCADQALNAAATLEDFDVIDPSR